MIFEYTAVENGTVPLFGMFPARVRPGRIESILFPTRPPSPGLPRRNIKRGLVVVLSRLSEAAGYFLNPPLYLYLVPPLSHARVKESVGVRRRIGTNRRTDPFGGLWSEIYLRRRPRRNKKLLWFDTIAKRESCAFGDHTTSTRFAWDQRTTTLLSSHVGKVFRSFRSTTSRQHAAYTRASVLCFEHNTAVVDLIGS